MPAEVSATTLGPLCDEELMEELREHVWSASSLEVWAECPVKWFVQRMLRAEDLDPNPEPLARGGLAHAVLKDTLEGLRERTGSARLTPARLGLARELLREALGDARRSSRCRRRRSAGRACAAGSRPTWSAIWQHAAERESPLEPTYLELGFGFGLGEQERDQDPEPATDPTRPAVPSQPLLPALDLGDGLRLRGRIDRVDLAAGGGQAVVYDYKGRNAPPAAKWTEQGNVQVALYMRAVEELLGLEAAGGFYQPLSGADLRARGVLDGESGVEIECVQGRDARARGGAASCSMRRSRRRARRRRRRGAASSSPGRGRARTEAAACIRRSAGASNDPVELRRTRAGKPPPASLGELAVTRERRPG